MKKLIFALLLFAGTTIYAQNNPGNDAIFDFTVTSMSSKPRPNELIMVKGQKTKKIIQGNTGADGKLSLKIPVSDTYAIYYRLLADTIKYKEVQLLPADKGAVYTINLRHDPPRSFTLKKVLFETRLSTLRKESYPSLDELVEALKSIPDMCIEIGGHTDNFGSPESNLKLSADRANAVRTYLIKQGIEPKRVTAKGFGDTEPVALNETPEGRQKNRRTEVRIVSE